MAITLIPRTLLSAGENCSLLKRALDYFRNNPVENDQHLNDLLVVADRDRTAVIEAYGGDDEETFGTPARAADTERDAVCGQLSKNLRGKRDDFDPAVAQSASIVYDLYKKHDFGGRKNSYELQSTVIHAFLNDCMRPDIQVAIDNARIRIGIEQLAKAQRRFEEAVQRKLEKVDESTPSVTALMEPLRQDVFELIVYLNSRERMNGGDIYGPINQKINEIVEEIEAKARARRARKENEREEADKRTGAAIS
jgi:hypothetical protein